MSAPGGLGELGRLAEMALLVSVGAPVLIRATRPAAIWHRWTLSATVALPGFLALHAAVTLWMTFAAVPVDLHVALHGVLFIGALLFWLPVLGPRRLPDDLRCLYLFVAAPTLDLPGVVIVAHGDATAGLAMIVGMLPVGLLTVALTWQWITTEERQATS